VKLSTLLPSGRRRREEELDEELAAHLNMAEAERVAHGETPADAAANARREFGNVGLIKQITREMWGLLWLEQVAQDLRFGLRMLWRSPGFSILAIFCLTLGIGANAAVFSWIEGILLRPYPLVANRTGWSLSPGRREASRAAALSRGPIFWICARARATSNLSRWTRSPARHWLPATEPSI